MRAGSLGGDNEVNKTEKWKEVRRGSTFLRKSVMQRYLLEKENGYLCEFYLFSDLFNPDG